MSSREVIDIIASANGGFNGEAYTKQIGVEVLGDAEAIYSLTTVADDPPTVERYHLVLTPILDSEPDPLPEEPEEPTL